MCKCDYGSVFLVFKVKVSLNEMSALKSDFRPLFLYESSKLESPWNTILSQLETMTVGEIMRHIGDTTLCVSGVHVKGVQCTFESIAQRHTDSDVASFLLLLYGLVMSCTSGRVHQYLKQYIRIEWVPWLFSARVDSEPVFVLSCRRSLKTLVEWMADVMEEASDWSPCKASNSKGDTALHIAVRRRQWDWAKWLLTHGISPYEKNHAGETPMMLAAPHHEKLNMFCLERDEHWYKSLHDALVAGRHDATWCVALLDLGADVNQLALYDAPVDSLIVLAKHGMDMNLGPLPPKRTLDELKVFYVYGRQPTHWDNVIASFDDWHWVNSLCGFFSGALVALPEEYKDNLRSRQCITEITKSIMDRLI